MYKRKTFLIFGLCLVLSGLLALPVTGFAKEGHGARYKAFRAQMMQNLNLSAEQSKQFKDVEEKFLKQRLDLYKQLHKDMTDLKKAMAEKPVKEKKVQEAVNNIIGVKEKLTTNYQDWWQAEIKVLKPEQQAQYLLTMNRWWKEVMAGHCTKEMGAQGQRQKPGQGKTPTKK
jgi:Spy/CpxP family protein refolding chaperone